jgi:phosphoribosylaminoimidazole-succinocarboxamide synthase
MTQKIQEIVFMTYAEIGRLNADGKIEFGIDTNKELRLGDELELDTVRNMNPETIEIDGETYEFKTDIL